MHKRIVAESLSFGLSHSDEPKSAISHYPKVPA